MYVNSRFKAIEKVSQKKASCRQRVAEASFGTKEAEKPNLKEIAVDMENLVKSRIVK